MAATAARADATAIADLTVLGADGAAQRVGDLWAAAPALLIWIRHYG